MIRVIQQLILLGVPFIVVYFWETSLLSNFTYQIIGALVILYFVLSARKKKRDAVFFGDSIDVFIFITVILLVVVHTGSFNSGLFFLLYFLCFGITFILEPITVFAFVIYLTVLFFELNAASTQSSLLDSLNNLNLFDSLLKIGSIVLIAPLAYYFGLQLRKEEAEAESLQEAKDTAESIVSELETVAQTKEIPEKQKEKIKTIVEKAKKITQETKTNEK